MLLKLRHSIRARLGMLEVGNRPILKQIDFAFVLEEFVRQLFHERSQEHVRHRIILRQQWTL